MGIVFQTPAPILLLDSNLDGWGVSANGNLNVGSESPPIPNAKYFVFIPSNQQKITTRNYYYPNGSSLAGWFRTSNTTDPMLVVSSSNYPETTSYQTINLHIRNGNFIFRSRNEDLATKTGVADGQWHYFVLYVSEDRNWEVYLDGVEVSKGTASSNFNNAQLTVGCSNYHNNGFFDGDIVGIAVFERKIQPTIPTDSLFFKEDIPVSLRVTPIIGSLHTLSPSKPVFSDTVGIKTIKNNLIEAIPGGTLIGGTGSITGTVRRKIGDLADVYSKATILLTDATDGRVHRRLYPNPDGSFIIPNLQVGRGEFIVSVTDWFSDAYDVAMNVRVGDVLDMVLVDKDATTPQPTHKVEGHVTNHLDQPISRKVCVYSRVTNAMLGSAQSGADGFYSIPFVQDGKVYVVCLPNPDEDVNAKIFDRVEPVPI